MRLILRIGLSSEKVRRFVAHGILAVNMLESAEGADLLRRTICTRNCHCRPLPEEKRKVQEWLLWEVSAALQRRCVRSSARRGG